MFDRSEINIQPWEEEFRSIKEGSQAHSWRKKSPIAYWKGNPDVASPLRMALLQCNDTEMWRAQIMRQVDGFRFSSPLQCFAYVDFYPEP